MPAHHQPSDPRFAARDLQKRIQALDPEALARARKVRLELQGVPDKDVPAIMRKLMKCQHVIAQELGFGSWDELQKKEYVLFGFTGSMDLHAVAIKSLSLPEHSSIRRHLKAMVDPNTVYRSYGTKEECDAVLAWVAQQIPARRLKNGSALPVVSMKKFFDGDDGDDWGDPGNMLTSYNEPSEND